MVKKTINIAYSCDDNFVPILGVSIASLFKTNSFNQIELYILDFNISFKNKKIIESICEKNHSKKPIWLKAKNIQIEVGNKVKTDRGSLGQYSRIFLGSIIPRKVKKIIYLDCDTLIISNLQMFFNLNLKGNTIGAMKDCFSKYYRAPLGLKSKDLIFNSGVMLIDLDKWRNRKTEEKLIQFIKRKKGKVMQGDQGALNAVLSLETFPINPRFNLISIFYRLSYRTIKLYRKPVNFYDEETIRSAKKEPVIIHFTSSFYESRPWENDCCHPYVNLWKEYKNSYVELIALKIELGKKKEIFRRLPIKLLLFLARIPQIYIKPCIYRRYIK